MGILAFLRETQEWGMAQRMKFNKAGLLALVLITLTGLAGVAWADDDSDREAVEISGAKQNDFVKSRTYVGGVGISATIDQWGQFTGTTETIFNPGTTVIGGVSFIGNPELDLIPT